MNYDSWKTGSGGSRRAEELADRCSDIEAFVDSRLSQAVAQTNAGTNVHWQAEPVLAEVGDDGEITLDLSLRLNRVPVAGTPADLNELAQAFIRMGESLSQVARSNQTPAGLKLAGSLQQRSEGRQAELG